VGALARQVRLRVRPGHGVHSLDGRVHYKAGDEFTLPFSEAADLLRGKNRRGFEVVEVIDDSAESGGERNDSRPS
jgi:hypothetical protein